jgi:stress response protein SCP2
MNDENLISFKDRTKEEKTRIAAMGGAASGVTKRTQKGMAQLAQMIAGCKPPSDVKDEMRQLFPDIEEGDIDNKVVLLARQFQKASDGDTKAFEVFRDTAGEKPVIKSELTGKDGAPIDSNILITQEELKKRADEMRGLNE